MFCGEQKILNSTFTPGGDRKRTKSLTHVYTGMTPPPPPQKKELGKWQFTKKAFTNNDGASN